MIRLRKVLRAALSLAGAVLVVGAASPVAGAPAAVVSSRVDLPQYPVCEASAAIEMPCLGDAAKTCVWVGDNEQTDALFEYDIDATGRLTPSAHWKIALGGAEVGDIEALARDGDGVLAIGSHGRSNGGEAKEKRARIAHIAGNPPSATLVAGAEEWVKNLEDCDKWIAIAVGDYDEPARVLRDAACQTIVAAEHEAEKFAKKNHGKKGCPATPLNVEGAVSVPASYGPPRIWLGLRAPTVAGKALLLRMAPLAGGKKRISFDGIAAIDLGGKAIRELTTSDGSLWGIAGAVLDSDTEPSRLWKIDQSLLHNGATITAVEFVSDALPPTSEGLVIQTGAKRAIVLADGDLGKDGGTCATAAGQLTVALP